MKWSRECLKLASMCHAEDGSIRSTSVIVGEVYHDLEGLKYKITDSLYDELVKYQDAASKKFKVTKHGKTLTLIGV